MGSSMNLRRVPPLAALLLFAISAACGDDSDDHGGSGAGGSSGGAGGDGASGGAATGGGGNDSGATGALGGAAGSPDTIGGAGGEPATGGAGGAPAVLCALPEIEDAGACRAARVLVLSDFADAVSGDQNSVTTYLDQVGFNVTAGPYFAAWDGADPSLESMDVVLFLSGREYEAPLADPAQTALKTFVAEGGGLIFTEWAAWTEDPALGLGLLPVVYDGGYAYGATWHAELPEHPLARDIPTSGAGGAGGAGGAASGYVSEAGWTIVAALEGATVAVSNATTGTPVASFLTCHGGTTVHLNHDAHYTTDPIAEGDLVLYRNAVHFAAVPQENGLACASGGAGGAGGAP
jgi:hypothetical protein